eukprot:UN24067
MGDFVDRGYHSLETMSLLILLKCIYPSKIILIRGNHESRTVTKTYGFYDEILKKYGSVKCWITCTDLFDLIPLSALINKKILCVHGGLSPEVSNIDHIRLIRRQQEIPSNGPFCDIVWSDPDDTESFSISPT